MKQFIGCNFKIVESVYCPANTQNDRIEHGDKNVAIATEIEVSVLQEPQNCPKILMYLESRSDVTMKSAMARTAEIADQPGRSKKTMRIMAAMNKKKIMPKAS